MRDVYRSDGRLKSFDELNRQFSIPFSRTVLQGLIRAVRRAYGSEVEKFNILEPARPRAVECLFSNEKTRTVYRLLLEYHYPRPSENTNAELKWNRDLNTNIDWPTVYGMYRSCTKNKKIIWFQDRLLHRILTTNQFVSRFTNQDSRCSFCKRDTETLIHLFCRCEVIISLWSAVGSSASRSGLLLSLNEKSIILGNDITDTNVPDEKADVIRLVILLFKFYIYRTKVASGEVSFSRACAYVKGMLLADRPVRDVVTTDKKKRIVEAYMWADALLSHWSAATTN